MAVAAKKDPDQVCIEIAARVLRDEVKPLGAAITQSQAIKAARATVHGWLSQRPVEWSRGRLVMDVGDPTADTIGFAKTILPALGRGDHPFDKKIDDWTVDEMALFIARAYDLMQDQQVATLERDSTLPM